MSSEIKEMRSHRYDDILYRERPVSQTHTPMSMHDRAAQFSPFAALTGYEAVIGETARYTEGDLQLDENFLEELNEQLKLLSDRIGEQPQAEVTFYVPDEKKSGGAFRSVRGRVRKIEEYERELLFCDGTRVPMDRIRKIHLLPSEHTEAEEKEK